MSYYIVYNDVYGDGKAKQFSNLEYLWKKTVRYDLGIRTCYLFVGMKK